MLGKIEVVGDEEVEFEHATSSRRFLSESVASSEAATRTSCLWTPRSTTSSGGRSPSA